MKFSAFLLIALLVKVEMASGATLVEDFSTLDHADPSNSTGVWNSVDHSARAQAFANSESTRPIDFGDGRDGTVNTANGYVFNTDVHPNGFNFQSLAISGGTIQIIGSHPLVIRSLTTIDITPSIQVNGANGDPGRADGLSVSGPKAVTCHADGGSGGGATAATPSNGEDGFQGSGSSDPGTHGTGQSGGSYSGSVDAIESSLLPNGPNFDSSPATDFLCGTGGAGGGGFTNGASFGSGGAGGAGGGVLKIVAVGDIHLAATEAKGGNGGDKAPNLNSPTCTGVGMGGFGGVIFFQTLGGLYTSVDPDVSGGHWGAQTPGANDCNGSGNVWDGFDRGDTASTGNRPTWVNSSSASAVYYDTDRVPAGVQSQVQSKSYDLGVLNASFATETVNSTGAVSMSYAGSSDGVSFSAFGSLQAMSNQGYRYLKFRATFTSPAGGGVAPKVTGLSIPYTDSGLASLNTKIFAGCGTLALTGAKDKSSDSKSDEAGVLFTLVALSLLYGMSRLRLERIQF